MIKKLLKFIGFFFGLMVSIFIGFWIYITVTFKDSIEYKELEHLVEEIKQAPPLPEKFYTLQEKMGYDWNADFDIIKSLNNPGEASFSEQITKTAHYLNSWEKNSNRGVHHIRTFQILRYIEKHTTQKECYNYYLHHFDFLYGAKGVKEAANYYFQKNLNELNDDEILSLLAMLRNPIIYNPKRNPEQLKKEIEYMKKKMIKN